MPPITKKSRLYIYNFLSISLIIILIVFFAVHQFIKKIESDYIEQQFKLNKRSAETYSKLLREQLNKEVDDENVQIKLVPDLIKICFENILDNAIRYTPQGGMINIRCKNEPDRIICSINDSGPGLSEEAKQKLFDYFGADEVMHHSEGFGLGLAAVKLIIDAHHGEVKIENCPESNGTIYNNFQ